MQSHYLILGILLILLTGCAAQPVKKLWPPEANEKQCEVAVINYDDLHSAVAIYPAESDSPPVIQEFSFGERNWYMNNHRGILDGIKALIWLNPSVMETYRLTPEELEKKLKWSKQVWRFKVSEEGRTRMLKYLDTWYDPQKFILERDGAKYFEGRKHYHFFTACHRMTAGSLRAGGLPTSPSWAITMALFSIQLNHAEKLQPKAAAGADQAA